MIEREQPKRRSKDADRLPVFKNETEASDPNTVADNWLRFVESLYGNLNRCLVAAKHIESQVFLQEHEALFEDMHHAYAAMLQHRKHIEQLDESKKEVLFLLARKTIPENTAPSIAKQVMKQFDAIDTRKVQEQAFIEEYEHTLNKHIRHGQERGDLVPEILYALLESWYGLVRTIEEMITQAKTDPNTDKNIRIENKAIRGLVECLGILRNTNGGLVGRFEAIAHVNQTVLRIAALLDEERSEQIDATSEHTDIVTVHRFHIQRDMDILLNIDANVYPESRWAETDIEQLVLDRHRVISMARLNNRAVGFLVEHRKGPHVHIDGMALLDIDEKQCIQQRFVQTTIDHITEIGGGRVEVVIRETNTEMTDFYKQLGFRGELVPDCFEQFGEDGYRMTRFVENMNGET